MTRGMLMLLAAPALAVLLACCGGVLKEDGSSPHNGSSSSQDGSSSQVSSASTANTNSVGRCAGSGGTNRQQERRGEVSNGKIMVQRTIGGPNDIDVIDEDDTTETHLTHALKNEEGGAVLSPDGTKIAFVRRKPGNASFGELADIHVMNADGTNEIQITRNPYPAGVVATVRGNPVWSPDSKRIAFTSYTVASTHADASSYEPASAPAEDINGIYVAKVDGTGLCMIRKLTNFDIPGGRRRPPFLPGRPPARRYPSMKVTRST